SATHDAGGCGAAAGGGASHLPGILIMADEVVGRAAYENPPAVPSGEPEQPVTSSPAADATRERIRTCPPEVGIVLMSVGVVGFILPGPMGTPLVLAGGLVLMPAMFGRVERWVERRFPKLHNVGMKHVDRFIDDFEKRYPPPGA